MIYKSKNGPLFLLLAWSLLWAILSILVLVVGVSSQGSTVAIVAIVVGVGILFQNRNDPKMVRKIELNGSQLTSSSLIGQDSIDLRSIAKIKLVGVASSRVGYNDRLIKLLDGDGKKAYIQLKILNENDRQQLWATVGPYLLNPKVLAPKNFVGAVSMMGVKQVYQTAGISSSSPTTI